MAVNYHILLWLSSGDFEFEPPDPSANKHHPKHAIRPNIPTVKSKKL